MVEKILDQIMSEGGSKTSQVVARLLVTKFRDKYFSNSQKYATILQHRGINAQFRKCTLFREEPISRIAILYFTNAERNKCDQIDEILSLWPYVKSIRAIFYAEHFVFGKVLNLLLFKIMQLCIFSLL